jgi:hypothetical protein
MALLESQRWIWPLVDPLQLIMRPTYANIKRISRPCQKFVTIRYFATNTNRFANYSRFAKFANEELSIPAPTVCDQLFNNATELFKRVTFSKATSTLSPHNVSSSSSQSSRESRRAVESYMQTVNLMHTFPPQQSTPSLNHNNLIPRSSHVFQPPHPM